MKECCVVSDARLVRPRIFCCDARILLTAVWKLRLHSVPSDDNVTTAHEVNHAVVGPSLDHLRLVVIVVVRHTVGLHAANNGAQLRLQTIVSPTIARSQKPTSDCTVIGSHAPAHEVNTTHAQRGRGQVTCDSNNAPALSQRRSTRRRRHTNTILLHAVAHSQFQSPTSRLAQLMCETESDHALDGASHIINCIHSSCV
jgi:hypothetical protein